MNKILTNLLTGITVLSTIFVAKSQNVGINTTGSLPSVNSILDLNTGNANNLGLIIPNVSLSALGTFNPPIANPSTAGDVGMMVYNTNAAVGSGIGYYYWDGATWVSVGGAANAWQILGNGNIVDGTNFLGTTNNVPINFQINGSKAGRIDPINFNTFLGYQSGNVFAPASIGHDNVAMGYQTLNTSTSVKYDVAIGSGALKNDNSSANTAVGYQALMANNSGTPNTSVGYLSLTANTSGTNNVAVGDNTLAVNTTGVTNTAIGSFALQAETGSQATGVGANALKSNTSGGLATAIGFNAAQANTVGFGNTALGAQALFSNSAGSQNTAVGLSALFHANPSSNNTAIGVQAGENLTTGSGNTMLGLNSLFTATGANNNVAVGVNALNLSTSSNLTAVGTNALQANTLGTANTALGYQSLNANNSGSSNTAVGDNALITNTTGSQNTALGASANVSAAGLTNATAIGFGAIAGQSNALILGNASAQTGIQTNTPQRALEIGGVANTERIDGLGSTGTTFNQASGSNKADLVYANDANGDLWSIPAPNAQSVLTSSATGVISWQNGSAISGSGTNNYYARWTPNGTTLGVGFTEDNGTSISMSNPASAPVNTQMLTVTGNATSITAIVGTTAQTTGYGLNGINTAASGTGIYGKNASTVGGTAAIIGQNQLTTGQAVGVIGYIGALGNNSTPTGVYGYTATANTEGVFGNNTSAAGQGAGVYGTTNNTTAGSAAIIGTNGSTSGQAVGVIGNLGVLVNPTNPVGVYGSVAVNAANTAGIMGVSTATTAAGHGVWGTSTASVGFGVYGTNSNNTNPGITGGTGIVGSGNGQGAVFFNAGSGGAFTGYYWGALGYGSNSANSGAGFYGTYNSNIYYGNGVEGIGYGGSSVNNLTNFCDVGVVGNYGGGLFAGNGAGVVGMAGNALTAVPPFAAGVVGEANDNSTLAIVGKNLSGTGQAIEGMGNNTNMPGLPSAGTGNAFSGTTYGLFSAQTTNANTGVAAIYAQDARTGDFVTVNAWQGGTHYKINSNIAGGPVTSAGYDLSGNKVLLHCPETPEFYYEDYGEGQLVSGKMHVDLDPTYANNIVISGKHPLRVFIQLDDTTCKGVAVINKTASGFDVIELNGGKSSASFEWHIVCNVKDATDNGYVNHTQDLRFEPAAITTPVEAPKIKQRKTVTGNTVTPSNAVSTTSVFSGGKK